MSSLWNNRISISIFGESHGPAIGVVIDNLPPGEYIDIEELGRFLSRRAPKKDGTTPKKYGMSLRKCQRRTSVHYHYIPTTPRNLPYMRRAY